MRFRHFEQLMRLDRSGLVPSYVAAFEQRSYMAFQELLSHCERYMDDAHDFTIRLSWRLLIDLGIRFRRYEELESIYVRIAERLGDDILLTLAHVDILMGLGRAFSAERELQGVETKLTQVPREQLTLGRLDKFPDSLLNREHDRIHTFGGLCITRVHIGRAWFRMGNIENAGRSFKEAKCMIAQPGVIPLGVKMDICLWMVAWCLEKAQRVEIPESIGADLTRRRHAPDLPYWPDYVYVAGLKEQGSSKNADATHHLFEELMIACEGDSLYRRYYDYARGFIETWDQAHGSLP